MVCTLLQGVGSPAHTPVSHTPVPHLWTRTLFSQVGIPQVLHSGILNPVHHLRGLGPRSLSSAHPLYDLGFCKFHVNLLTHMGLQVHIFDNRDHFLDMYVYNKYISIYYKRVSKKTQGTANNQYQASDRLIEAYKLTYIIPAAWWTTCASSESSQPSVSSK